MLHVAVICGGISEERGISLNSARSFSDHTQLFNMSLTIIYMNPEGSYYLLTPSQLYSNTPSDFDFKLGLCGEKLSLERLIHTLKNVSIVFPLIHGKLGEDGTLQALFEAHHIPYVGSSSSVCRQLFNKHAMHTFCKHHNLPVLPAISLPQEVEKLEIFWDTYCKTKAILKPVESGSSVGVHAVTSLQEVKELIPRLRVKGFSNLLLEAYCDGKEFTVCVLQNKKLKPTSLIPLEIEIQDPEDKILSFRRKYLPTEETRYYCPPRFSKKVISNIRARAEWLFKQLGMQDFVRMDGWVTRSGEIIFSDFNPISGMEQNSFLFQQAAQVGLSHADLIAYIISHSLARQGCQENLEPLTKQEATSEPIYVLMGGSTAERQTSLMSGTNVFLKLKQESSFAPIPFLLDKKQHVWQLPYSHILHHTVEEVEEHCHCKSSDLTLKNRIRKQLGLNTLEHEEKPIELTLEEFIAQAKTAGAFVFIALHGGFGEDGSLQELLEQHTIAFNGSDTKASALCMDKHQTSIRVASLNHKEILPMPQLCFSLSKMEDFSSIQSLWKEAQEKFNTSEIIIKPLADGCSAGVYCLHSVDEFFMYIQHAHAKAPIFSCKTTQITMASSSHFFLLEPFIHTDKITVTGTLLQRTHVSGWCEMTIGILERGGDYEALPPSITIAEHRILSLEEKFQGGTGINLTPPPEEFLSAPMQKKVRENVCLVAKALGLRNYARIDLFVECVTGRIQVIEANTLPALTPSTVLFHQALCRNPPLTPRSLLIKFIETAYATITI